MKQNITIDQLNELSEAGKDKLREWWNPQPWDMMMVWRDLPKKDRTEFATKQMLPLLSIGQMIEFLDEEYGYWVMSSWPEWNVKIISKINSTISSNKELCDSLWNEVKQILDKEQ